MRNKNIEDASAVKFYCLIQNQHICQAHLGQQSFFAIESVVRIVIYEYFQFI